MSNVWKSSVLIALSVFGGGSYPRFPLTGSGALVALAEVVSAKNVVDKKCGVRGAVVAGKEKESSTVKYMQITDIYCEKQSGGGDPIEVKMKVDDIFVAISGSSDSDTYPVDMDNGWNYEIPEAHKKNTAFPLNENPNVCLVEDNDMGCVQFTEKWSLGKHRVHLISDSEDSSYYLNMVVTEATKTKQCRWVGCGGQCRDDEWKEIFDSCWCDIDVDCCKWVSDAEDLDSSVYPEVYQDDGWEPNCSCERNMELVSIVYPRVKWRKVLDVECGTKETDWDY